MVRYGCWGKSFCDCELHHTIGSESDDAHQPKSWQTYGKLFKKKNRNNVLLEDVTDVQKQFRRPFQRDRCSHQILNTDATVHNIQKQQSERPQTAIRPTRQEQIVEMFLRSAKTTLQQYVGNLKIPKLSIRWRELCIEQMKPAGKKNKKTRCQSQRMRQSCGVGI